MEVSAEAKRIMVVALGKLYSSRSQRGGLRLHRSLLLTLVMKSARDIYHVAQATTENTPSEWDQEQSEPEKTTELHGVRTLPPEERPPVRHDAQTVLGPAEEKENLRPSGRTQQGRKRRSKAGDQPDFIPYKKAKLEHGNYPQNVISSCVLVDYVKCGGELSPSPTPIPMHRAIAAC